MTSVELQDEQRAIRAIRRVIWGSTFLLFLNLGLIGLFILMVHVDGGRTMVPALVGAVSVVCIYVLIIATLIFMLARISKMDESVREYDFALKRMKVLRQIWFGTAILVTVAGLVLASEGESKGPSLAFTVLGVLLLGQPWPLISSLTRDIAALSKATG